MSSLYRTAIKMGMTADQVLKALAKYPTEAEEELIELAHIDKNLAEAQNEEEEEEEFIYQAMELVKSIQAKSEHNWQETLTHTTHKNEHIILIFAETEWAIRAILSRENNPGKDKKLGELLEQARNITQKERQRQTNHKANIKAW